MFPEHLEAWFRRLGHGVFMCKKCSALPRIKGGASKFAAHVSTHITASGPRPTAAKIAVDAKHE